METLSIILKNAFEGGFIKGFLASGREGVGKESSHHLFAEDTLIFSDSN